MFKPFFVCNFCIILNDFSRNPLETFHEGSECMRVNDLLRLNLKLKIAVRKMQHTCLKQRRGGRLLYCLSNVKKTALLVLGGFPKWPEWRVD